MSRDFAQPTALSKLTARLVPLAMFRFAIAVALTSLDWFGFQFIRRPDIAPYLSYLDRVLLPILFAGALATLLHLWVLTFQTFRSAVRTHDIHERT